MLCSLFHLDSSQYMEKYTEYIFQHLMKFHIQEDKLYRKSLSSGYNWLYKKSSLYLYQLYMKRKIHHTADKDLGQYLRYYHYNRDQDIECSRCLLINKQYFCKLNNWLQKRYKSSTLSHKLYSLFHP
jgi:hypothetical protein